MRELAQLLVPAVRWDRASGFALALPAVERAVAAGVGGFMIEGGERDAMLELTTRIRDQSETPPLLVLEPRTLSSGEFGAPLGVPPPGALASLREMIAIRRAARAVARDVARAGCNAMLAPPCDVARGPVTHAFGQDPGAVAVAAAEWIDAAQAEGVLCIASRFPGGGASMGSESGASTIRESEDVLYARDLVPFRAAIDAGVAGVSVSTVAYAALDASGAPAALSRPILHDLLRGRLGFDGLTVADASRVTSPARHVGAPELVGAGIDLVLRPVHTDLELRALMDAVRMRRLDPEHVHDAAQRRTARATMAGVARAVPNGDDDVAWLRETTERTVEVVRGRAVHIASPVEVAVPGTSGDRADELVAALAAGIRVARGEATTVKRVSMPSAIARAPVVIIAVPGPTSARDVTALGDESHRLGRDAIVIWCEHPAIDVHVPTASLTLACWEPTPTMLRAVGRWLVRRV